MVTTKKAAVKKAATPEADASEPVAKPRKERHGALSIAAEVLRGAGKPMSAGEMMDAILAAKKWETSGKTPAATLYSAIIREIAKKGADARFKKTERGKFAIAC